MERLTQRDLRALLDCLRHTYASHDLDTFRHHVFTTLPTVVPAEVTSYNEMSPTQAQSQDWVAPAEITTQPWERNWLHVIHEHPVLAHNLQTGDGRARKLSDFLTQRQFHRLALYHEFYRPMGVEHLIGIALAVSPPLAIGIALHRRGPDFSERERLLLNLLRPHMAQAHRNAVAFSQLQQALTQVVEVLEGLDRGVIVLGGNGRIQTVNTRARQWVAEYFGQPAWSATHLPDDLQSWVRAQEAMLADPAEVPPVRQPLVVEREDTRLVVRLLTDAGHSLLLLEEERTRLEPTVFMDVGLTRREAEVLVWVAEGKTDEEISVILGVRARTVQKHVEHIFAKLGVETRTAAAVWAHGFHHRTA